MTEFKPSFTCDYHPQYKAVRKPMPGCVLCHAMWQERLVFNERAVKDSLTAGRAIEATGDKAP